MPSDAHRRPQMRNFSTLLGESPKNQGWKNMSFYFFNIKKSHF